MPSAEEVVREFCKAVSTRDASVVRPLLNVGMNVGMPAKRGIDNVIADVEGQWAMFTKVYDFEIRALAADGTALTGQQGTDHDQTGCAMDAPQLAGVMFWLRWKRLSGS